MNLCRYVEDAEGKGNHCFKGPQDILRTCDFFRAFRINNFNDGNYSKGEGKIGLPKKTYLPKIEDVGCQGYSEMKRLVQDMKRTTGITRVVGRFLQKCPK